MKPRLCVYASLEKRMANTDVALLAAHLELRICYIQQKPQQIAMLTENDSKKS